MLKDKIKKLLRQEGGQTLTEYAWISFMLVGAIFFISSAKLGGEMTFFNIILRAYQIYFDSFNLLLNLPFP